MFGKTKLKVKEDLEARKEKNKVEGLEPPVKPIKQTIPDRFEIRRYATSVEEKVLDNETGEETSVTEFIVDFANYLASKGEQ